MRLPGAAWVALALGLTALVSQWLQDYVSAPWVAGVVVLLSAIAKIIETYANNATDQPRGMLDATSPLAPRWKRVLFGG